MIRETYYFLRHGPGVQKRQKALGSVEFMQDLAKKVDADGFAESVTLKATFWRSAPAPAPHSNTTGQMPKSRQ